MKKILIFITVYFLSFLNTFAVSTVILNPDYSFISSSINDGTVSNFDKIRENIVSRNRFCFELGGFYLNHTFSSGTGTITEYDSSLLLWKTSVYNNYITSITCDIPVSGSALGGLNVDGLININSLGIFTINGGKIYVEKDNFFYLIVTVFIILLLLKSMIFIFVTSFKVGKNLSSGKGLKFK